MVVPGDGDDGQNPGAENEEPRQARHQPVGVFSPAAHPRDRHGQTDQSHYKRGHHHALRDPNDLISEVRGVRLAARSVGAGGTAAGLSDQADVPDALLHHGVRRSAWELVEGSPVWRHGGGKVQDPSARSHDHTKDQDARRALRHPDPLLPVASKGLHGCPDAAAQCPDRI